MLGGAVWCLLEVRLSSCVLVAAPLVEVWADAKEPKDCGPRLVLLYGHTTLHMGWDRGRC